MIKEAESLDIKEGNQILDIILKYNKLPQVNTKMHTQNMMSGVVDATLLSVLSR